MDKFSINVNINVGVTPELMTVLKSFAKSEPKKEPKSEPKKEPKSEPKKEPEAEPKAEAKEEYTELDVRAAMHRTRARIEGEDYKDNAASEGRKKWHRALTAWFKNTAAGYGSEKPSEIDNSDARLAFIKDCDAVEPDGDKLIIKITPF